MNRSEAIVNKAQEFISEILPSFLTLSTLSLTVLIVIKCPLIPYYLRVLICVILLFLSHIISVSNNEVSPAARFRCSPWLRF